MTHNKENNEDVAGLFAVFGGNASEYQEFALAKETESAKAWPLLAGLTAGSADDNVSSRLAEDGVARSEPSTDAENPNSLADANSAGVSALFAPGVKANDPDVSQVASPAAGPALNAASRAAPRSMASEAFKPVSNGTPLAALFHRLARDPTSSALGGSLLTHWRTRG